MFTFSNYFGQLSISTGYILEELKELITLLDSPLFLSPDDFKLLLPVNPVANLRPEVKLEDPFAPGYSSNCPASTFLNISPGKAQKNQDNDKDSFIDDNFRKLF